MTLPDFLQQVQQVLLPATAVPGDPIGTQIASVRNAVGRVLVCMEITDIVVDEAVEKACDTIITFHPLIYKPLVALAGQDRVARLAARLIREDISVICVHTSFDAFPQGTNYMLAQQMQLEVIEPLERSVVGTGIPSMSGHGMGLLCAANVSFDELIERIAHACGGPLRFCPPPAERVNTVAIVAGSGMSFLSNAIRAKADVFVTADVKYHDFHASAGVIGLVDPGHYEMEQHVPRGIISSLTAMHDRITFIASEVRTSPVQYHLQTS